MDERRPISKPHDLPPSLEQVSQSLQGQPLELRLQVQGKALAKRALARKRQRAIDLRGAGEIVFSI